MDKKVILFLLGFMFSSGKLSGQVYTGLSGDLVFYNPLLNIATYERGGIDPAYGRGILGGYINPATLSLHKGKTEVFFAYSLSMRYKSRSSILLLDADSVDILSKDLILDSDIEVIDPGGPDFIGFATRFRGFSIGAGIFSKFKSSIDVSGVGEIETGLTFDRIPSTLQFGDTTLLLLWRVTGWGNLHSFGRGRMDFSKQPIFFRMARNFGIVSIGLGYDLEFINGSSTLKLLAQGRIDSILAIADSAVNLITGHPITVVAKADFSMEDSLFNMAIHGKTHGIRQGISTGFQIDLKFLKLGLVGKLWLPFKMYGQDLKGMLVFSYGIPDTTIYPPDAELINDTLFINAGTVEFRNPAKDTINMFNKGMTIEMPLTYSAAMGLSIGILHISGFLNLYSSNRMYYGGWIISGGLYLPLPGGKIGISLNQATDFIYDGSGAYIPIHAPGFLGLGGTFSLGSWELGMGLKFNLMSLGIQSIGTSLTRFKRPNVFNSMSISFGISKTIGG